MTCCGKKRAAVTNTTVPKQPVSVGAIVWFKYLGQDSLTVVGQVTHTVYRFTGNQAPVATDPRDYKTLVGIPGLKQTATP